MDGLRMRYAKAICEAARRLGMISGIGPIMATALTTISGATAFFRLRPSFGGVAGLGAAPEFERRQGASGRHFQGGRGR
jgi:hypothetical protein